MPLGRHTLKNLTIHCIRRTPLTTQRKGDLKVKLQSKHAPCSQTVSHMALGELKRRNRFRFYRITLVLVLFSLFCVLYLPAMVNEDVSMCWCGTALGEGCLEWPAVESRIIKYNINIVGDARDRGVLRASITCREGYAFALQNNSLRQDQQQQPVMTARCMGNVWDIKPPDCIGKFIHSAGKNIICIAVGRRYFNLSEIFFLSKSLHSNIFSFGRGI